MLLKMVFLLLLVIYCVHFLFVSKEFILLTREAFGMLPADFNETLPAHATYCHSNHSKRIWVSIASFSLYECFISTLHAIIHKCNTEKLSLENYVIKIGLSLF